VRGAACAAEAPPAQNGPPARYGVFEAVRCCRKKKLARRPMTLVYVRMNAIMHLGLSEKGSHYRE